jgi:hypothetical protein
LTFIGKEKKTETEFFANFLVFSTIPTYFEIKIASSKALIAFELVNQNEVQLS